MRLDALRTWPPPEAPWARVTAVEWRPLDPAAGDPDVWVLQRQAALTAAWAGGTGSAVVGAWVRTTAGAPLSVWLGGERVVGTSAPTSDEPASDEAAADEPASTVPLMLPPAVHGTTESSTSFADLLAGCEHWRPVEVVVRPPDEARAPPGSWRRPSLDDALTVVWTDPVALVVVAVPATRPEIDEEAAGLELLSRGGARRGAGAELDTEAIARRYVELRDAAAGGLWHVAVGVGARSSSAAAAMAGLVGSSIDLHDTCWRCRPADVAVPSLDELCDRQFDDDRGERDEAKGQEPLPTAVVVRLVRPPLREVPGVRAEQPADFDLVPTNPDDGVELGDVVDAIGRPVASFAVSSDSLNRHTFVCGATGSGKSQTVRGLLEGLARRSSPIPWLVLEPAKAEYGRMAGRLSGRAQVVVIRPGDPDRLPVSINPLEPASLCPGDPALTFPLQSHADLVRTLFLAAFRADEPFPQVLSRALTDCYRGAGWDLVTGEALHGWDRATGQPALHGRGPGLPRIPTLGDLQHSARRVVDEIGYGDDIRKNVRGFVDVRIGSLRTGSPGRLFEGGHPLDFAALLQQNVVVEIEGITNDQDKAFVMGALLIRLYEQLLLEERERFKRDGDDAPLRHITVIEEAHRLLRDAPPGSPGGHSVELFASLLAEVRAYGEGIVVVEQIPSKLIRDVIKNTALKVVHRLPAADDRETVGATMNLSDPQSAYVVTMDKGRAAVFADGMDRPLLVQMHGGQNRERADDKSLEPTVQAGMRRSRSCGPECRDGPPCDLRQLRTAERLVEEHPALTFWMEVSIAAHACGSRSPGLTDARSWRELRQVGVDDRRRLECAIAHAVDVALTPRYHALVAFFDPDAFGCHLSTVACHLLLDEGTTGVGDWCRPDHGRWRMGLERFADISYGLSRLASGDDGGATYHDLAQRAAERGLEMGEAPPAAQLAQLEQLSWRRYGGDRQRMLLLGTDGPFTVVTAAAAIAGPGQPSVQLAAASAALLVWDSPAEAAAILGRLTPPDPTRSPP